MRRKNSPHLTTPRRSGPSRAIIDLLRSLATDDDPEEGAGAFGGVTALDLLDADFSRHAGGRQVVSGYLGSLGQPLARQVEAAMYAGRELSVYNLASRREEEVRGQARCVFDRVPLNTAQDFSTYGILGKRRS